MRPPSSRGPAACTTVPQIPGDFDYEAAFAACAAGDRQTQRLVRTGRRAAAGRGAAHRAPARAGRGHRARCLRQYLTRAASYDASRGSARGWDVQRGTQPGPERRARDGSRHVDVDDTTTQALEADMSVQAHHEVEGKPLNSTPACLQHCLRFWTRRGATACCTPMWTAARRNCRSAWAPRWAP